MTATSDVDASLTASASAYQNTSELFRSNLFRRECAELLSESHLHLRDSELSEGESLVRWASHAEDYVETVRTAVAGVFGGANDDDNDDEAEAETTASKKRKKKKKTKGTKTNQPSPPPEAATKPRTLRHLPIPDLLKPRLRSDRYAKSKGAWEIPVPTRPLSLEVVGGFAVGTMTTKEANGYATPTIDAVVRLEDDDTFWQQKDYLNYRYLDKRNLLLHHVGTELAGRRSADIGTVAFSQVPNCPCKLAVVLTPPPRKRKKGGVDGKARFRLRLLVGVSPDLFPPSRSFPTRNNLPAFQKPSEEGGGEVLGTPAHNSCVLAADGLFSSITSILSETAAVAPSFRRAVVLLKVWLAQRGLRTSHDGVGGAGASLLLAWLFRSRAIGPRADAWEAVVSWWRLVAGDDGTTTREEEEERGTAAARDTARWYRAPPRARVLVLPDEDGGSEERTIAAARRRVLYEETRETNAPPDLVEAHRRAADGATLALLDPTLSCDLLAHCSPSAARELAREARRALGAANASDGGADVFRRALCANRRFARRYDAYVRVPLGDVRDDPSLAPWTTTRGRDLGRREAVTRGVVETLAQALGDRATGVRPLSCGDGEIDDDDADGVPSWTTTRGHVDAPASSSPSHLVLGLRLNPETAPRAVDRGPPVEDAAASRRFYEMWGDRLARLRRFRDGAVVPAVVWRDVGLGGANPVEFLHDEGASAVEKIVQHVLGSRVLKPDATPIVLAARTAGGLLGGAARRRNADAASTASLRRLLVDPAAAHRRLAAAFESLSTALAESVPDDVLPVAIGRVEPTDARLRRSSLFPPAPQPSLGGDVVDDDASRIAGATSDAPIAAQIRFEDDARWPTDVASIGAAKCAMLLRLAEGIESGRVPGLSGPVAVYPAHVDLGHRGYSWRITVRADQELRVVDSLAAPSAEAAALRRSLVARSVAPATHHAATDAVFARHPAAAGTARLARRWTAAHMLSGALREEALELIVARVFGDAFPADPPGTAWAGLGAFLRTVAEWDWERRPFVVDPQGRLDRGDRARILAQFERHRASRDGGPPMYVISPFDRSPAAAAKKDARRPSNDDHDDVWFPSFTSLRCPERVVLSRLVALARLSHRRLSSALGKDDDDEGWSAVFEESPSALLSYDALLRIDPSLAPDKGCRSTGGDYEVTVETSKTRNGDAATVVVETPYSRSARRRHYGPKELRVRSYKNLDASAKAERFLHGWRPVQELVDEYRRRFGDVALFFYNELCPEVVAVKWRPDAFEPRPFSVARSERKRPVALSRAGDSVVTNAEDVLRELEHLGRDVVVDVKVLNDQSLRAVETARGESDDDDDDDDDGERTTKKRRRRRKREAETSSSSEDEDDESD